MGIAILWLVRVWLKPPATVRRRALELGWVAAPVVAVADTAARLLGLWHYTTGPYPDAGSVWAAAQPMALEGQSGINAGSLSR